MLHNNMQITVHFYSYFKELAGCSEALRRVPEGKTLGDLLADLGHDFPKLAPMRKSMLAAVGVDYQTRDYQLQDGDEVSLFPPVQGG
jgi:molybdopterin converting factor small subunit